MNMLPLLGTLLRNKTGPLLIGLQIALTLAIVGNSVFIIQQYVRHMRSPTGIDEANIFTFTNSWLATPDDLEARIKGDLAALRGLPGVVDAVATNAYPLSGYGANTTVTIRPDQSQPSGSATLFFVDEHALAAYGLNLIAGRWFNSAEITSVPANEIKHPATIIVTQAFAKYVFRGGNALGQVIYFTPDHSARIVGIVERGHTGIVGYQEEDSIFMPVIELSNGLNYVVRTLPGRQAQVMSVVERTLYAIARQRVIQNLRPFIATRHLAYTEDRANAVMLVVVCVLMLAVTAFGVVGLTAYWVTQRRQYIGMRRALGARRIDILKYFHAENLLIATAGSLVGVAAGLACNVWLLNKLDGLQRMTLAYICAVALIVVVLCQAAVLWPALRAAAIPPAQAIRNP